MAGKAQVGLLTEGGARGSQDTECPGPLLWTARTTRGFHSLCQEHPSMTHTHRYSTEHNDLSSGV